MEADLNSLCTVVERKSNDLIQLQKELRRLNVVSDELSNLITETGDNVRFLLHYLFLPGEIFSAKLEGLCEEVESALAYLDVLCHTDDMQNIKLEQRFQLALYRERKMADLNEVKSKTRIFN